MQGRKRINLSVDHVTYNRLANMVKRQRYKNECELVMSMINVVLDCLEPTGQRQLDMPEDDVMYIDEMFAKMSYATKQADGDGGVAITRRTKNNI